VYRYINGKMKPVESISGNGGWRRGRERRMMDGMNILCPVYC
jgi:hypothetical protein